MPGCADLYSLAYSSFFTQEAHRMAESVSSPPTLVTAVKQPLIGLVLEEDGRQVVRYFVDEAAADAAVADHALDRALAAIGSWSDLDWAETVEALDRIRHESPPTPPIEL
jgi:hypothetical protein